MELTQAKEILSVLANGVNPTTGEILPDNDVCNQAPVVRALYTVLGAIEKMDNAPKKAKYENAGKPWTSEEDSQLLTEYERNIPGVDIAKLHQRSKSAIAARLVRLGVITERDALR